MSLADKRPGKFDYGPPRCDGHRAIPEQLELSEQAAFALGNEVPEITRLRYETKALLRTEHWLYEGLIAERIQAVRSDSPADGRNR
jgi:hypothetical protein